MNHARTVIDEDLRERRFARCRGFGIDPAQVYSLRILGEAELRQRLTAKRDLVVAAEA